MKSSHSLPDLGCARSQQHLHWGIAIVMSFATIGLSLPACAGQTVTNDSVQTTTVTGSNNTVNQHNNTTVRGGNRGSENRGASVRTRQNADVAGDGNTVTQSSQSEIEHRQRQNR